MPWVQGFPGFRGILESVIFDFVVLWPWKCLKFAKMYSWGLNTVFTRISARGAYLIFGLFLGGRLFERGAYSRKGAY